MEISFSETFAGRFLDLGGAVLNVRHPEIGARGDGESDDAPVFVGLAPGHYVVPAGRYRLGSAVELPPEVSLIVLRDAVFVLDAGASIRVRGHFEAGPYRVFADGARVRFDPGSADRVVPHWWGAVGDGRADDTAAIRAALDASPVVYLPAGTYRVTSTIDIGHAKQVRGESGALISGARTTVQARAADLGEGQPIFRLNPLNDTRVADVLIEAIHFRGDNDSFSFRRLSDAEDRGVIGIDATHVKDHVVIRDCSFRALKRGIGERKRVDYTGQVYIHNCHFFYCYRAIELITSTPLSITLCDFRECADWIEAGNLSVQNCAFNNSSFSTEFCGVSIAGIGLVSGCWFEGGNHQIRMRGGRGNEVTLVGNHFSTCFSANGATKYTVFLAPGRLTAVGNYSAANNRFFDFREGDDYGRYSVRLLNNTIETPYWRLASNDPHTLGFDYVGDETRAAPTPGATRATTITLGDIGSAGVAERVVRIGRIDGVYRYIVEVFAAAASGPEPRIVTRHVVQTQPEAGTIVVSTLHEDVAAASVTFEADRATGECQVRLVTHSATPLRQPSVRIEPIGASPIIGAERA